MGPLETALEQSIRANPPKSSQRAAIELARHYARELDEQTEPFSKLGPPYLKLLDTLGYAAHDTDSSGVEEGDDIDELAKRRARFNAS